MDESPRGWAITPSTDIPTVAFGNQKGGTGKTTATINSAAALATRGRDVLAIDMDPQADMTKGLGLGPGDEADETNPKNDLPNALETDKPNLLDVLVDNPRTHETSLSEILIDAAEYEHLQFDIIPSHKDMGLARDWMDDTSARPALKRGLDTLIEEGYTCDFILIDCPPDLSVLTDAAFIAAQNVFLAAQTQATSRDALNDMWKQLETIETNHDIEIAIIGLLANMYREDGQSQKFLEAFNDSWASMTPIFKLPMRVAIQRAWDNGSDIFMWEDTNDQSVECEVFLEIAETMERAFEKAPVEA